MQRTLACLDGSVEQTFVVPVNESSGGQERMTVAPSDGGRPGRFGDSAESRSSGHACARRNDRV